MEVRQLQERPQCSECSPSSVSGRCWGQGPSSSQKPHCLPGRLFPPSPPGGGAPTPNRMDAGSWRGPATEKFRDSPVSGAGVEAVLPSALTAPFPTIPAEPTCSCNSRLGCAPPPHFPVLTAWKVWVSLGATPSFQGAGGHVNPRPRGEHGGHRVPESERGTAWRSLRPSHHFSIPVPLSSLPPSCCPLTGRGCPGVGEAPWPVLAPRELALGPRQSLHSGLGSPVK